MQAIEETMMWMDSNATSTNGTNETTSISCRQVNQLSSEEKCDFIRNTSACRTDIGYFEYTEYMYCLLGPNGVTSMVAISVVWLLVLFAGLGITANDFLCPSLFIISKTLRMSQNVAGVTLLAFGNGSPDIFAAIAGIKQKKTEMVIGGLIGGGIFVTTVVAGSIFLTQNFTMMKRPFLRDVAFYLTAAGWAFYLFFSGAITLMHAIGFIVLYVMYICVVVASRYVHQKIIAYSEKAKEAGEAGDDKGLTFKGSKGNEFDDPEAYGVSLTSFFKYRWDEDRRRNSRVHYCYDNDVFAISLPPVPEDDLPPPIAHSEDCEKAVRKRSSFMVHEKEHKSGCMPPSYDEANTNVKCARPVCNYPMEEKSEKLPFPEEVHQWSDFIDKISPINRKEWPEQKWWERGIDILKSPLMFILLITTPVVDYQSPRDNWSRILNSLHCATGPLFIIFATGHPLYKIGGVLPLFVLILLIGLGAAATVYYKTTPNEVPRFHTAYAYLGFGVAVVWIYCIANEIVVLLQAVGIVFNLSDSILGLTILAWGNCLLDFLSNLAVAKKGFPRMGIAACFGAPFLTLLLGVGVPSIIELASSGRSMELIYSRLTSILFGTLVISLLSTVTAMSVLRFQVRKQYGIYLICLYLTFLVISVLAESSVF